MIKVKVDMTGWKMWEHGVPDSKLTVIKQVEDYVRPDGRHESKWLCECNCDKRTQVEEIGTFIKNGQRKSCGCLKIEKLKKYNQYDLSGDIGIGYTTNTHREFYFDLEDFALIKDFAWYEDISSDGYKHLRASISKTRKKITMHHLFGCNGYDHINRNPLDNRRINLRPATETENARNCSLSKNNTSGVTGVCWNKTNNKWRSYITINYERKTLGMFLNKEDAIRSRLQAEKQYFGEFAPQKHLFEEYGINT